MRPDYPHTLVVGDEPVEAGGARVLDHGDVGGALFVPVEEIGCGEEGDALGYAWREGSLEASPDRALVDIGQILDHHGVDVGEGGGEGGAGCHGEGDVCGFVGVPAEARVEFLEGVMLEVVVREG